MKCPYCKKEISFKQAQIRSTPENKYYWGIIIDILSNELGYTKNSMHETMKEMFLKEPVHLKTKEGIKEVWITKSTANLTVAEFEEYLEKIRQWAIIYLAINIPEPNEGGNNG